MSTKYYEAGYLPVSEAADRIGVHAQTVRNWYRAGKLRVARQGPGARAKVWVLLADVERAKARADALYQ